MQTQIKKQRWSREILDGVAIDFVYPVGAVTQTATTDSLGFRNVASSTMLYYRMTFDPPLVKAAAAESYVRLVHLASRRSDTRIALMPSARGEHYTRKLAKGALHFVVFETHALRLVGGCVSAAYITIVNEQYCISSTAPILVPLMDYGIAFFNDRFQGRYTGLPWVPPDRALLAEHCVPLLSHMLPQSNLLWFKVRARVSSSAVAGLLGYYADEPGTPAPSPEDAAKDKKRMMSSMSFGNAKEADALICYLSHFGERCVREAGYTGHPGQPTEWGAAPDGLVTDALMTQAALPLETRADFPSDTNEHARAGVLEIKSSLYNCNYAGGYFAQCTWEMMCLDVCWADIVRYSECNKYDATTRMYVQAPSARAYRFFRTRDLEKRITALAVASHALRSAGKRVKFNALVHTPPYVAMRAELDALAARANTDAVHLGVPLDALEAKRAYTDAVCRVDLSSVSSGTPAMDRIQTETWNMFDSYQRQEREEFTRRGTSIVEDIVGLIRSAAAWK